MLCYKRQYIFKKQYSFCLVLQGAHCFSLATLLWGNPNHPIERSVWRRTNSQSQLNHVCEWVTFGLYPPAPGVSPQLMWKWSESQSCLTLQPHGLHSLQDSPGQNTGVGSLSLLQGIIPTQGSNPGLPHCRRILYTSWATREAQEYWSG